MDIFFGKLPFNTYQFQGNLIRLIKPISEHSIAKYFFCTYDRMKYYVHKSSKPSLKNHQQPLSQWWSLFSTRLLTFHKIVFHNNNSCWHFNFFCKLSFKIFNIILLLRYLKIFKFCFTTIFNGQTVFFLLTLSFFVTRESIGDWFFFLRLKGSRECFGNPIFLFCPLYFTVHGSWSVVWNGTHKSI